MGNLSNIDAELAKAIGAPAHCDAALVALDQLVESFSPPELNAAQADLWIHQMTQYLLQRDRDVYLGYLAPTTVQ